MRPVACFDDNVQKSSVNVHPLVRTVMVNRRNVAAKLRNDAGDVLELTRLVLQSDDKIGAASRLQKAACDNAREDRNVIVAA